MGVLSCDRKGCENILCDNVSYERNEYLCEDCKQELKSKGVCDINIFMQSEKVCESSFSDWESYVDKVFVSRYDEV